MKVAIFDNLLLNSKYISDGETFEKSLNHPSYGGDIRNDLYGQIMGLYDMWYSRTIKVPKVVGYTKTTVKMEKMKCCRSGSSNMATFGTLLAKMHRSTPKDSPFAKLDFDSEMKNVKDDQSENQYGYWTDNTAGLTYQINKWETNWSNFWIKHRIKFLLDCLKSDGRPFPLAEEVLDAGATILHNHKPLPSLLHGDLWSGNIMSARVSQGKEDQVYAFDPAPYYGDHEVDLAMTRLFGEFPPTFYEAYESEWPLSPGSERRNSIYELYYILNHDLLFGGGYRSQALSLARECIEISRMV